MVCILLIRFFCRLLRVGNAGLKMDLVPWPGELQVMSESHHVYVILGANQGNARENFGLATKLLEQQVGPLVKKSALYESEPWGMDVEDMFYNQVLCLDSRLHPMKVIGVLLDIERTMGRVRKLGVVESRSIDIDILFIDEMIISEPGLEVPHPRFHLRRFALQPMAEIAPDLIHPIFDISVRALLEKCTDPLHVIRLSEHEHAG